MKRLIILAAGAGLAIAGCATVPDDAPEELHSAKAAVDAAKEADAEDTVPKTMHQAERSLDRAVVLFKESRRDGDGAAKLNEAKQEATRARRMANNAATLHADVRAWDGGDLHQFMALKRAEEDLRIARIEFDSARSRQARTAAPALPEEFAMTQPIVFFPTDRAEIEASLSPALGQLTALLRENDGLTVELIGHADHRGSSDHNDALAASRAQSVAQYLRNQGIAAERIKVTSRGSRGASAGTGNVAAMQIDRRVDAAIRTVAH